MDPTRFDRLVRTVGQARSRRAVLRTLGGAALGTIGLERGATAAAQGTPVATATVTVAGLASNNATLFVQTATAGTLTPNPAASATPATGRRGTPAPAPAHAAYLLTLQGHNGETIAFSDRPERRFGEVKTSRFLQIMGFTSADPPNAALVVDTPQQADAVVLLELTTAAYDGATQTLTYEADVLHQYPNSRGSALAPLASTAQTTPAATFESASLFIDDCPDGEIYCVNETGVQSGYAYPVGFCYSWANACCAPCAGDAYWTQQCNANDPSFCQGSGCTIAVGEGILACPT